MTEQFANPSEPTIIIDPLVFETSLRSALIDTGLVASMLGQQGLPEDAIATTVIHLLSTPNESRSAIPDSGSYKGDGLIEISVPTFVDDVTARIALEQTAPNTPPISQDDIDVYASSYLETVLRGALRYRVIDWPNGSLQAAYNHHMRAYRQRRDKVIGIGSAVLCGVAYASSIGREHGVLSWPESWAINGSLAVGGFLGAWIEVFRKRQALEDSAPYHQAALAIEARTTTDVVILRLRPQPLPPKS